MIRLSRTRAVDTAATLLYGPLLLAGCSPGATPVERPSPRSSPSIAVSAVPAGMVAFDDPGSGVHLIHPASIPARGDFTGHVLTRGGWRLVWGAGDPGPGRGIVSFVQVARPAGGTGSVSEYLRIGLSRDPSVVATCTTAGLASGSGGRLPDRTIGGRTFAAYRNGDAGMSQAIDAVDLRTVADGACYAVERYGYAQRAGRAPPESAPTQADAAKAMDAVLASLRIGSSGR